MLKRWDWVEKIGPWVEHSCRWSFAYDHPGFNSQHPIQSPKAHQEWSLSTTSCAPIIFPPKKTKLRKCYRLKKPRKICQVKRVWHPGLGTGTSKDISWQITKIWIKATIISYFMVLLCQKYCTNVNFLVLVTIL